MNFCSSDDSSSQQKLSWSRNADNMNEISFDDHALNQFGHCKDLADGSYLGHAPSSIITCVRIADWQNREVLINGAS